MNPFVSTAVSQAMKKVTSFDTFSSFGVSVNSPMSSQVSSLAKRALSVLSSRQNMYGGDGPGLDSVGNVLGDGSVLSMDYKVSIFSSHLQTRVVGYLQDRTRMRVSSDWQKFVPFGQDKYTELVEMSTQAAAGVSLIPRAFSRRMWKGTEPLKITLELIFQAVTDPLSEVVRPCAALLQMAAPGTATSEKAKEFTNWAVDKLGTVGASSKLQAGISSAGGMQVLTPPGPSPFWSSSDIGGDDIDIMVGRFLAFKRVIISNAEVEMDTKMHRSGKPVSARAMVDFESYEVLTKSDLASVFGVVYSGESVTIEKNLAAVGKGVTP